MKYFVITIALLIAFTGFLQAFDTKGLVLYLKLDEGNDKTAKDSSAKKNHGELMGDAQWVDGVSGKAIRLSDNVADNKIVIKDNESLDITDQITIGMWVNIETVPDGSCSLITKEDTYMIHTSNWSGKGIEQELLLWPFDTWQTAASTPIQLNDWYHVLGTFDGKDIKMYINSELKGQRAYGSKITTTNNNLVVGRDSRACCNTRRSALTFDEVVLFNRAISDKEVKKVMEGGGVSVESLDCLAAVWGYVKLD